MFSSNCVGDYCKEWDNWNIVILLTALGWHDQWWSLYNRMWQWRLVSCEAGTSECMYYVIVEVLYCYKCVVLFLIQNKVSHLITTPFQASSRWTCSLLYYSVFAAHTLLCAVTWLLTLWPWPLTLNTVTVLPVSWWNYVPNLNAIEQSTANLLQFKYLT